MKSGHGGMAKKGGEKTEEKNESENKKWKEMRRGKRRDARCIQYLLKGVCKRAHTQESRCSVYERESV